MIQFKLLVLSSIILIPLIAVVIDAYTDKKNILGVKHFRGAIIYMVGVASPYLFFIDAVHWWQLGLMALLTRLAWFNPILYLMLGVKFTYTGDPNKPKEKRSLLDRFEIWTGINIFILRISYIIIYLTYLIYFYAAYN